MKYLRPLKPYLRIAGLLGLTAGFVALQAVLGLSERTENFLPRYYLKGMRRMLGIKVVFNAASAPLETKRRVVYAPNHMSELDPIVFGSILKNYKTVAAGFLRTLPVAAFPVVGKLMAMTNVIFVRRNKFFNSHNRAKFLEALNKGRNVLIFPEGVTSDGSTSYEWKLGILSALWGAEAIRMKPVRAWNGWHERDESGYRLYKDVRKVKLEHDVVVQPIALRTLTVNGQDVTGHDAASIELRKAYTWYTDYKDESIPSGEKARQCWNTLCSDIVVELTVMRAMNPKDYADPRAFADEAEGKLRAVFAAHQTATITRPPMPSKGEKLKWKNISRGFTSDPQPEAKVAL